MKKLSFLILFALSFALVSNAQQKVAFKTSWNKYLVANAKTMVAIGDGSPISQMETFLLIDLGNNKVGLKAYNGMYVCADKDNPVTLSLVANRQHIGAWETFEIIKLGGNQVALKAWNGQYVCADRNIGGSCIANRAHIGPWETLTIEYLK